MILKRALFLTKGSMDQEGTVFNSISMHPGKQLFNMATLSKGVTAGLGIQTQPVRKLERTGRDSGLFPSLLGKSLTGRTPDGKEGNSGKWGQLGGKDSWGCGGMGMEMGMFE